MLLIYERLNFLVAKFVRKCLFLWRKIIFKCWSRWFCVSCGVDSSWCALQSWSNTFWCSYHKAGQDLSVDLSTSSPVCLVTWAPRWSSKEKGEFPAELQRWSWENGSPWNGVGLELGHNWWVRTELGPCQRRIGGDTRDRQSIPYPWIGFWLSDL